MPKPDGLEAVNALDRRIARKRPAAVRSPSAAAMPQRREHKPKIDVRLIESRERKMYAEEGHVEHAAVERDQERELGDVGGKLVEVHSVDEQRQPPAGEAADHGHGVVWAAKPVVSMSKKHGVVGELRIEPPRLPGRQAVAEEGNVALGQGVERTADQWGGRLKNAPGQPSRFRRREEAGPIENALLP